MSKQLYRDLLVKKHNGDIGLFILDIKDINSIFWGCCRDFSKEILRTSGAWRWLSFRVDDFAKIIEEEMINKLDKWVKKGSLAKKNNSLEHTITWLFDRHTNSLKNLFNRSYKLSLSPSFLSNLDDQEIIYTTDILDDSTLLEFLKFDKNEKIKILKKVWDDNLYDFDFNLHDMEDLCAKYGAPPPHSFLDTKNIEKYEAVQAENGHFQLVFTF
ncbi:MAG: hypothetical protein A2345_02670 [Sulfurimonas sp. RIFOXYB12_FULL_35_9]|nr:hypothetical protein [Sulfurimonas sp.]OHE05484.1 MAG: hypothetical protein A2345_02670 [Sulfurimonas sp. RIFOXYB12_FULL_35_9]